jgi:hypothetical protein
MDKLHFFLRMPGHSFLADGVVPVHNCGIYGEKMDVFNVLLGGARFVQHFQGYRKAPNVIFNVNLSAGSGSSFLELIVKTHNGCGVGMNGILVADYGLAYDLTRSAMEPAGDEDRMKKNRGALDAVLAMSASANDIEMGIHRFP